METINGTFMLNDKQYPAVMIKIDGNHIIIYSDGNFLHVDYNSFAFIVDKNEKK